MTPDGTLPEPADERLRRLFETTHREVLRYALRRTMTEADAEDAAAETYAIAWRRHRDLPPDHLVVPWLYGVCRRVLANQRRSLDRRQRLAERAAARHDRTDGIAGEGGDFSGPAMEALERLGSDDQEILGLVAWENLGHAEIAVALGISVNAVAIRIHRARQRFIDALNDDQRTSMSRLRRWQSRALKGIRGSRTSGIAKAAIDDGPGLENIR